MLMAGYGIEKNGKVTKLKSEVSNPCWGLTFQTSGLVRGQGGGGSFSRILNFFRIRMLFNAHETIY